MDKQITNKGQWFIDQLNVYQSANSDHQSIKKNFIIRLNEFEIIIASLKNKEAGDSLQNELILGRRGSGKSTLLKRIEIEILEDEELKSKYIPINLAEEQAGIYRLFDLWEETLKEICHHFGTQLHLKDFKEFKQEQDYTRYLYQNIHEICVAQNRRIVLLLDNFDRIVENFTDDGNLMREMLINFNDLAIIAGSTRMDEHFWSYDMPFYEFFRRHRLESLDREELYKLLNHWGETLDIPELKTFINNNPGKIENIRLLTDGLPRTIQFFIQMVLQDAHSHGYEYLKKIMDNVTPLYQERLNSLTPPFRKIILEMAFLWEASTTKQLVEKCRMDSKLISAHLKTLVDKGIVDKVETSKKNHLYRISERFFNMWLIITQGNPEQKRKAKWLSIFLENWYDANDLKKIAKNHIELLKKTEINRKDALILSKGLSQCRYITTFERDQIIGLTENLKGKSIERSLLELPQRFEHILDEIQEYINNQNFNGALELAKSVENEEDGFKFLLIGDIYYKQDNYVDAIKYLLKAEQKGNRQMYLTLGIIYETKKKFDKAKKCYLKAKDNGEEDANIFLAMLFDKQKKTDLAEKYYKLAINNGDNDAIISIAQFYFNQEKYDLAEEYHLLAVEKNVKDSIYFLGLFYDINKKYELAEKYYLLAIDSEEDEKAIFMLGILYEHQKKYELAEKYYLISAEKGETKAIFFLAILYDNQQKNIDAEKYYLMAIEKKEEDAIFNLALFYDNQEKYIEAEKYYLKAIEKDNEDAIFNLALLYDNQEKYTEAEKYYLMAIEDGNDIAINHLAEIYNELKRHIEAEKLCLMAIKNGNKEALFNIARTYFNQKNYTEAENYYLQAIENGINEAMNNLAILYDNQNNYVEAEKYYLMAIDKQNKSALFNLALLYAKQEKFIEAEKYYLLAIEEGFEDAINNMAILYEKQGQLDKARKYYLMAIEKGNVHAISNLATAYYNSNDNKKTALELFQKAFESQNSIAHQMNLITAEIWNGIFNNVEERIISIIQKDTDKLYEFIFDLLVQQQKTLILKMFNHKEFGKTLQDKYSVLYYACLLLNNITEDNLELRIPPEIRPTIDDVLANIDEKQKFYGYK